MGMMWLVPGLVRSSGERKIPLAICNQEWTTPSLLRQCRRENSQATWLEAQSSTALVDKWLRPGPTSYGGEEPRHGAKSVEGGPFHELDEG